jgi:anti-sigma regulatory factor (Ser/Thr protein kinase)/putative methionine-R-sulfoxide reductase with GAF domain
MPADEEPTASPSGPLGTGQTSVLPGPATVVPDELVRELYRLSDPALSELDLDDLLHELLARVQNALAVDTVAILLLDAESQNLVARAAKGLEEEVEQGVRIPLGQGFAGRIASERVAIFIADVDHAEILNPILREKGIHSLLGVPLIVEGELVGVLHVGSLCPRTFTERDVAVLQLAAARAAPAIERAQLFSAFEREHRVALALQRSLLPKRLPSPIGVSVAGRYLPARDGVGGDWYDVIELPSGRVGLAIGDVVGHGVDAAALMGQLRTALHSYAVEGHGPARTLELVDRFLQATRDGAMATAAYAVFDVGTSELRVASAGHLPPLLIGREQTRLLDVVPGAPLGVMPHGSFRECTVTLADGETIVLYTDGLVERRGALIDEGLERMTRLLHVASSAEDACVLAMSGLLPRDGPRDDVAMIALHIEPTPVELHLDLPADPKLLHEVRLLVRRWLNDRGATEAESTDTVLALAEACANVTEHAYPPGRARFTLDAVVADGEVEIVVGDSGRWRAARGEDGGRGLPIMRAAMDEVDVHRGETGTKVTMRRRLGAG